MALQPQLTVFMQMIASEKIDNHRIPIFEEKFAVTVFY